MITGAAIETDTLYLAVWVTSFALYWGIGFGYVSRAFERDADLFGADNSPDFAVFATALERIAYMNAVSPDARSWRHGSIRSRVEFLRAAEVSEAVRTRFFNRLAFIKAYIVTNAIVTAAAIVALEIIRA